MADEDDDGLEDRPELVPQQVNAANPKERRKRESLAQLKARQKAEWLHAALRHPAGRSLLWDVLKAAGTFEEKYGFVPGGPNSEATWAYRGQKDLGLSIYHSWSLLDPEGMLSLVHEFQFGKTGPKGD